jgi:hypothetical protein
MMVPVFLPALDVGARARLRSRGKEAGDETAEALPLLFEAAEAAEGRDHYSGNPGNPDPRLARTPTE